MVSQVVCVICSTLPESHTTEITFYKFPKATERPVLFKAWKNALLDALAKERPELSEDASLNESYVCSRHFIASDFSFDNGKLVLFKDAVPSRNAKELYDVACEKDEKVLGIPSKEYEPSTRTNNFASTLMKDFVTTSHHNLRSDLICTETSRVLTPSASEYITTLTKIDSTSVNLTDKSNEHKRRLDLEHKIESFEKIFKRLRSDNLLTESYVNQLKESGIPEAEQLLKEVLKTD